MELKGLASSSTKRIVAVLIRNLIQREIELWRNISAWIAQAKHHGVVFFLAPNPVIAVVLLIGTVKLQDLDCPLQ